ncbi:MAG: PTS sugar transporter subunit IIA [Spirochaetes bacterium]|jgi:PTS system fructose-specific IIA component|nr:PTS sugar transporter subunit IIA [Spirochaetota bacterium]
MMFLSENLKKNNILIEPLSKTSRDLIEEMLDRAIQNNDIKAPDKSGIFKALIEREKSMSTGIGNGVAIPHCSSSRIDDLVMVMSLNDWGIDFDSIDGNPVRIAILLVVPKNKLTLHIKTLANIAKIMSNDELRSGLLMAKNAESVIRAIKKYEVVKK